MSHLRTASLVAAALAAVVVALPAPGRPASEHPPKRGGILITHPLAPPSSLSPHEESTVATVEPASPCFSNLVYFDPLKRRESLDTLIPELAEKWSWQDNYRNLVFFLRRGVKWHDGQPFTSRDVKYTYDLVRGAPDAQGHLRINPRKLWYANVEAIETPDPYTVIFRLKRPQPSLLLLLASGYSPVYPAHVPVAEFRTKCIGTGPFKLKEYRPGESIEYVRNPDYFVKDRPYLDGIKFLIISDRSTQVSALEAGRLDITVNGAGWSKENAETAKKAVPKLVMIESATNVNDNVLINFKRPPFTDRRVRLAINLAINRRAYVQGPRQGGATEGGAMLPAPDGVWGLPPAELAKLPGMGDPVKQRAEAVKLLAQAGFGPNHPLKLTVSTRAVAVYTDVASWLVDQLKRVGIDASLQQFESAVWFPKMARREYEIALNLTGLGVDDPDGNFYENYWCGSPRNYSDYCSEEIDKMIEEQSQTLDTAKRRRLVNEIDEKLQLDGARPILGWGHGYTVMWPYVKNYVPHQTIFNSSRFQEVWLDK